MFLSKVELDRTASLNPYEWHRALWQLFPDRKDDGRDFLFRIDQHHFGPGFIVLLQSQCLPQTVGKQARVIRGPKQINFQTILPNTLYRFRVTVNAIKEIRDIKDPQRKIRVPLIKEAEQIAWLTRKLDGAAILMEVMRIKNPPLYFRKKGQDGKLVTVTFDGILKVNDPELLRQLMVQGIGAAKSFGCGLISIASVN